MKLTAITKGMCVVLPINFYALSACRMKLSADIRSNTRCFSRLWTITSLIRLAAEGVRSTPAVAEGAVSLGCGCTQRRL